MDGLLDQNIHSIFSIYVTLTIGILGIILSATEWQDSPVLNWKWVHFINILSIYLFFSIIFYKGCERCAKYGLSLESIVNVLEILVSFILVISITKAYGSFEVIKMRSY